MQKVEVTVQHSLQNSNEQKGPLKVLFPFLPQSVAYLEKKRYKIPNVTGVLSDTLHSYCDLQSLFTELFVSYQKIVSQINTQDNCNLPL